MKYSPDNTHKDEFEHVTTRGCIEKGAVLFGLQGVLSVARLEKYGKKCGEKD